MTITAIAESFQIGSAYTSGILHIRLNDHVRQRYRRHGTLQDGYEFLIDNKGVLKVKRADKDGKLMSLMEWLRYGPFVRFALIPNQPVITNLLPSLIPLADDRLTDADCWHLLTYSIEWKVESAEHFYRHFLQERDLVSEYDVLATIASAIRAEYLHYLHEADRQSPIDEPLVPLDQATLTEFVIPQINQRLVTTGITIRRFYRTSMHELPNKASNLLDTQSIVRTLLTLRPRIRSNQGARVGASSLYAAIISGLLSHLGQALTLDKQWLELVWRLCSIDITFDELRAALTDTATQDTKKPVTRWWQHSTTGAQASDLPSHWVIQRLRNAGRAHLRSANRMAPQEAQQRNALRRKAFAFFAFALLLNDAPIFAEEGSLRTQHVRIELYALIESLHDIEQQSCAAITFFPGSTVHLMAVTAESIAIPQEIDAANKETVQLVQEILPLLTTSALGTSSTPVKVWTPAAAAAQLEFIGAAETIALTLQVLEPNTNATDSEVMAALFWTWQVRAKHDQFSLRLRTTDVATLYEVELQDAEFIDLQPVRSLQFPKVPQLRLKYEPLELALLLDGYWLATSPIERSNRPTGLSLLVELLDRLDEFENLTKRGLLIHAVICLDEHITQDFLTVYGPLPCLYTLGDAPIETTAQLVAEWLQPWVERWNDWAVKPYPVDTDIALEKGFHYLRQLRWQQTTHPAQRAILAIGRSRPHDHANYFSTGVSLETLDPKHLLDQFTIPYDPADRFSVTDLDWREELSSLRQQVGTILALCDPGLPNPHYRLPTSHLLFREYQEFWATVDPGTLLDVCDKDLTQCAEMGIDRVLQTLDTQLFQRRAVQYCEPALALPLAQIQPMPKRI